MPLRIGRGLSALRGAGVTSRLSSGLSRFGSSASSILKTSGGGIAAGAGAGYGYSELVDGDESRRVMILAAVALVAAYSLGQLFDIQIGG